MILEKIVAITIVLTGDFHNFKLNLAGRHLDFGYLTHLLAQKTLADRRVDGEFAFLEIGFLLRHDGIGHHHARLGVLDLHGRIKQHLRVVHLGFVEDAGIENQVLQFGNLGFKQALGFLGGIIFGVFGEVAFVACFLYGLHNAWTLAKNQVVELVLQFL